MKVSCKYTELVALDELTPHPKNRNKHSHAQIERLAKLMKYQGIRHPIIVSNRSNYIVAGHGRVEAIRWNDGTHAPVDFQDFESDEHEIAFLHSDNAIAEWAELDLSGINFDLQDLGPDFDIDHLGIKNFVIEPADKKKKMKVCPKCSHEF